MFASSRSVSGDLLFLTTLLTLCLLVTQVTGWAFVTMLVLGWTAAVASTGLARCGKPDGGLFTEGGGDQNLSLLSATGVVFGLAPP